MALEGDVLLAEAGLRPPHEHDDWAPAILDQEQTELHAREGAVRRHRQVLQVDRADAHACVADDLEQVGERRVVARLPGQPDEPVRSSLGLEVGRDGHLDVHVVPGREML